MFKNTFQSGFLSILYSIGSKPLQIWKKEVRKTATCANHGARSRDDPAVQGRALGARQRPRAAANERRDRAQSL